jgi:hypothetical protein
VRGPISVAISSPWEIQLHTVDLPTLCFAANWGMVNESVGVETASVMASYPDCSDAMQHAPLNAIQAQPGLGL